MNAIGEFGLSLAVLAAIVSVMAALAAVRFQSAGLLLVAKLALLAVLSMFLLCSVALLTALVGSDFSLDYVARFTERTLPIGYRLAAFWAGQEGSLLLWAVLLAAISTIAVFTLGRKVTIGYSAVVIITLSLVCAFFGLLILYAASPFAVVPERLLDGRGLNPLLQDPGMIAHPPVLFAGYALFTVPFAMMVAALITGQRDDRWVGPARRWVLAAWLFLSIGIVLGAKWAYTTLGWGGYWGWDPVENASLLPWLTATAFIHSLMVQRDRGMFRVWNAVLLYTTFLLCIFGTYLTRSGIVDSVHGFGQSSVGTFFGAFLIVAVLFGVTLIVSRLGILKGSPVDTDDAERPAAAPDGAATVHQLEYRSPEPNSQRQMEALVNREGAILATNLLLGGMMLVVLIGTLYPVISQLAGKRITLGAPFYNAVVCPLGLLLVALMSVGPLLTYGAQDTRKLSRQLIAPLIVGAGAAAVTWAAGWHSGWALACSFIAAAGISIILMSVVHTLTLRLHDGGNPLLALAQTIDSNHRRYGAHIVHIGVILMIVGVTGSSVFSLRGTSTPLHPGQSADVSGLHVTLQSLEAKRGENYAALEAVVLAKDSSGRELTLRPQRRVYDKWREQNSSIVAIDSTWKNDVYINLAGWESDETGGYNQATLEVIANPLVSWIWTGGWVLAAGALLCMTPRLSTLFAAAPVPVEEPQPSPTTTLETPAPTVAQAASGRRDVRKGRAVLAP